MDRQKAAHGACMAASSDTRRRSSSSISGVMTVIAAWRATIQRRRGPRRCSAPSIVPGRDRAVDPLQPDAGAAGRRLEALITRGDLRGGVACALSIEGRAGAEDRTASTSTKNLAQAYCSMGDRARPGVQRRADRGDQLRLCSKVARLRSRSRAAARRRRSSPGRPRSTTRIRPPCASTMVRVM